jgi:hypothetical protein
MAQLLFLFSTDGRLPESPETKYHIRDGAEKHKASQQDRQR